MACYERMLKCVPIKEDAKKREGHFVGVVAFASPCDVSLLDFEAARLWWNGNRKHGEKRCTSSVQNESGAIW